MLLIDIFLKGGLLMIPISLCSIFSLAIILERIVSYSRVKGNIKKLAISEFPN